MSYCILCESTEGVIIAQEGSHLWKANMNNKLYSNYYCITCIENPNNESVIWYDEHPHLTSAETHMDWSQSDEFQVLGYQD